MVLKTTLFAVVLALGACRPAHPADAATVPSLTLVDTAGGATAMPSDLAKAKLTVVVFYADHCPCFHVHEARIAQLRSDYGAQGVRVMVVDSEIEATAERDAKADVQPITLDPGARLADALGAEYATFTVVFDAEGHVRYRGGLDSDKNHLHDDAKPFVRDALDELLAGRDPRVPEGKTLGCSLMKR